MIFDGFYHVAMVEPPVSIMLAELQARWAIDRSTTIGMRFACDLMARRVRNDDYSSATYRD
jgi:hypothetical protein